MSGNIKVVPVNNVKLTLSDKTVNIECEFLGSEFKMICQEADHLPLLTLMNNIEMFGKSWWDNYKKIYTDSLCYRIDDYFFEYVNTNVIVYSRDKKIDEILDEPNL